MTKPRKFRYLAQYGNLMNYETRHGNTLESVGTGMGEVWFVDYSRRRILHCVHHPEFRSPHWKQFETDEAWESGLSQIADWFRAQR